MRLSFPHVIRGFLLTVGVWLLLFGVPPLQAQTDTASNSSGDISPWWAVPIVAVVIALVEVGRRYINSRIDARIETERDARVREGRRVEQDSNLRMETLKADRAEKQTDSEALRSLANSLDNVAKSNHAFATEVSVAYQYLARDREQAVQERQEFRMIQSETNKELGRQADELVRLATAMEKWSVTGEEIIQQIKDIRERIGGEKDEPPLTKLIGEAAEAAKKASEALSHAAEQGGGQPTPQMGDATLAMKAASDAIGRVEAADKASNTSLHAGDLVKLETPTDIPPGEPLS